MLEMSRMQEYSGAPTSYEAQHSQLASSSSCQNPDPDIVPQGVPVTVGSEMPVGDGFTMIQAVFEEFGKEAGRPLSFPLQS
jgi:hypothetical protein